MHRLLIPMSLLLAAALAAPVAAQNTAGSGTVTESGRPIAGATVLVDGDTANPLITDQDGAFSGMFAAGDHKFKVALHGYQPIEQAITVTKDKAVIADFALDPVVQIMALTVPASMKQGTAGKAQVAIKNSATTDYSIDQAALRFLDAAGNERTADFQVQPDAANPATIKAGATAMLNFTVTPAATAATGKLTAQASLFAFDTAMGKNLVANPSFEQTNGDGTLPNWGFGGDDPGAVGLVKDGNIWAGTAITGANSLEIHVPVSPAGDVRAYWSQDGVPLDAGKTYTLSGYVRTDSVEPTPGGTPFGASVYIPIPANNPYEQPPAPYITGTRDWRKDMVVFQVSADASSPVGYIRGEIQQSTGTAWFDNISLTEGTDDGSLTVTGGDQALEVTP
jgi:hypothetical protein